MRYPPCIDENDSGNRCTDSILSLADDPEKAPGPHRQRPLDDARPTLHPKCGSRVLTRRLDPDQGPARFCEPRHDPSERLLGLESADVQESLLPRDLLESHARQCPPSLQGARDLSPFSGEDQFPPGKTPVGWSNCQWLQFQQGLRGEHRSRRFERPDFTLVSRAPDLILFQNPPFNGLTAQEGP